MGRSRVTSRMKRAVALGLVLAGAGAVVTPALAARKDPRTGQWIIECGKVPPHNSSKAVSGFEVWGGPATGNGTWYGLRSGDPYYVANVDPSRQSASVYLWQPWHSEDPYAAGLVQGPFFVDMSVTVDKSGVRYCDTNYNMPPTRPAPPRPPVTVPPRIPPGATATQPAR